MSAAAFFAIALPVLGICYVLDRLRESTPAGLAEQLATANACEAGRFAWLKREYFYPLKAKILRRRGVFAGYARQEIIKECWRCNGNGQDPWDWDSHLNLPVPCRKCGGSGIWDTRVYWLETWRLGEREFFVPLPFGTSPPGGRLSATVRHIHGPVTHGASPPYQSALACTLWLMMIHSPGALIRLACTLAVWWLDESFQLRWIFYSALSRVRYLLRNRGQEVPF